LAVAEPDEIERIAKIVGMVLPGNWAVEVELVLALRQ
jgi:hypothetical protein